MTDVLQFDNKSDFDNAIERLTAAGLIDVGYHHTKKWEDLTSEQKKLVTDYGFEELFHHDLTKSL